MSIQNLKRFCHLLGGLIIIVLAFLFFENNLINLSITYIVVGSVFVIIAGIYPWLETNLGRFTVIFFLLEAAAFWYASKSPFEEDDAIVTDAIRLAAIAYIILAGFFLYFNDNKPRKHRRRKRKRRTPDGTPTSL